MPEKEVAAHGMSLLSYAWGLFVVPLRWLWSRGNKQSDEIDRLSRELVEHKLYSARNMFRKKEVTAIIAASLSPVQDSISRIEKNIALISERLDDRGK